MKELSDRILNANRILLTTHRNCDGDGLGAELGLHRSLSLAGKQAIVVNPDGTPKKYRFLNPDTHIQYYDENPLLPWVPDLVLVFDTNDHRLIEPLFSNLTEQSVPFAFIDHHPILKKGPSPNMGSWINTDAASTGEMAFDLIKQMNLPIDRDCARALYTSITFDTQLYRFVRNSPKSHLIAAELLGYDINPEEIHRHLFGNQTVQKMSFLAKALTEIEYHMNGQLAMLKLRECDIAEHQLESDEVRDIIDTIMNIESLQAAIIVKEEPNMDLKVSLRSKGLVEVLSVAESVGGGGHKFAAGALVKSKDYSQLKHKLIDSISGLLKDALKTG